MDNAIVWLIRLLAAHLLADFLLHPKSWVEARRADHLAAKEYWFHLVLITFFSAWFTCFDTWWVPLVIFVTHGLIDWWKSHRPEKIIYFALDQVLHLLVIVAIWMIKFPQAFSPTQWLQTCMADPQFWAIAVAVIFLTNPVGIVIGMLTKSFKEKIGDLNNQSLENAGTWIGILERLIIFFLVLIKQYEAIGLLIAAKSIIRLKEGEQKMSEYVLIGTLLSVSVAVITGFIVSKLM